MQFDDFRRAQALLTHALALAWLFGLFLSPRFGGTKGRIGRGRHIGIRGFFIQLGFQLFHPPMKYQHLLTQQAVLFSKDAVLFPQTPQKSYHLSWRLSQNLR